MTASTRSPGLVLGTLAVLLLPALSLAAPPRWALTGFASANSYAMSDINEHISVLNFISSWAGYGTMDEINTGPSFGGGVRATFNDQAWVELDYERLLASSEFNASFGRLKLDVPSHGILASAGYLFPGGRLRFGVGGGLGYYTASGSSIEVSGTAFDVTGSVKADISATGIGAHAFGLLDAALSDPLHAELLLGYRYAPTGDVEVAAADLGSASLEGYSLDWSGVVLRAGLALHFGTKE